MQCEQRCSPSKKQLGSKTVRNQRWCAAFHKQHLSKSACRVMCRSTRCQCICGVITSLVQSEAKRFPPRAPREHMLFILRLFTTKTDTEGISALWQSNCLFFVSKHSPQRSHGDRFVSRVVSWYCSSLWWWPACRRQQWTRCLSCRYVCFPLFSIWQASVLARSRRATSFRDRPAVSSGDAPLSVKSVGACQCQPIPCSTLCTVAAGPSHISSPFA